MSEDLHWGPWVAHDGKGCPLPKGTGVEFIEADGHRAVGVFTSNTDLGPNEVNIWDWEMCRAVDLWHWRVIRYRIRKPRASALDQLREIAASPSTPITAPEGPVRQPEKVDV